MKFSERSEALAGQEMFQILQRAQDLQREGRSILHFELGDPDFDTPPHITESLVNAVSKGFTHYSPSTGLPELKEAAINAMMRGRRRFAPKLSQVLVTAGANIQLYFAMACTLDIGDEVIIPDPGFVSYYSVAKYLGIKIRRLKIDEKNSFRPTPADVRNCITPRTRMIILNSPSNPLGAVMTEQEIRGIYDLAKEYDLWVLSDEVYTRYIYDNKAYSFFSGSMIDHCEERTILVNGFSKSFAMTGWRLGILTAPEELTRRMGLLLETIMSCTPTFIQRAAISALREKTDVVKEMVKEYEIRRDIVLEGLAKIPNISCVPPDGAFYAFPNITKTGMDSRQFCDHMLEEAGVALAPGPVFGENGEGYFRLAYCTSREDLTTGLERMRNVL